MWDAVVVVCETMSSSPIQRSVVAALGVCAFGAVASADVSFTFERFQAEHFESFETLGISEPAPNVASLGGTRNFLGGAGNVSGLALGNYRTGVFGVDDLRAMASDGSRLIGSDRTSGAITINLSDPARFFGFDFIVSMNTQIDIRLFDDEGTQIRRVRPLYNEPDGSMNFIGFESTEANIARIQLNGRFVAIDGLTFGLVPTPGVAGVFGAAGLITARRRR